MAQSVEESEKPIATKEVVKNLWQKSQETKQKMAEVRAELKVEFDSARDKGLNRKAFKILREIVGIENQQERANTVETLKVYLGYFDDPQGDMFGHNSNNFVDDVAQLGRESNDIIDVEADNVVPFQQATETDESDAEFDDTFAGDFADEDIA